MQSAPTEKFVKAPSPLPTPENDKPSKQVSNDPPTQETPATQVTKELPKEPAIQEPPAEVSLKKTPKPPAKTELVEPLENFTSGEALPPDFWNNEVTTSPPTDSQASPPPLDIPTDVLLEPSIAPSVPTPPQSESLQGPKGLDKVLKLFPGEVTFSPHSKEKDKTDKS